MATVALKKRRVAELTEREKRFVSEYITDFNAAESAKRAGYSPASALRSSQHVLKRVRVQKELAKRFKPIVNTNRRTADWTLTRLEHLAAILSKEDGPHYNARNAIRSLELLGKYHKLFTERVELTIREDLGDKIMDARQRAAVTLVQTTEIDGVTGDQTITKTMNVSTDIENIKDISSYLD